MAARDRVVLTAASIALALLVSIVGMLVASRASADTMVGAFGVGAGQYEGPTGVAVDHSDGTLYVVDRGNSRIGAFKADGGFVRAFGWDVVGSGPGEVSAPSEQQKITLGANTTGGELGLVFGSSRVNVPFDAPASGPGSVESALNGLASVGGKGGSVTVTGPNGGPYVVTFGDSFAGDGVPAVEAFTEFLVVSGGAKTATVTTLVEGGAFEVCEPSAGDTCQAGSPGTGGGQLQNFGFFESIAVDNDPTSPAYRDIYAVASNRVQRFSPTGEFVLAFGDGVNKTTGGDVCTAASGDTCGPGVAGSGPGQLGKTIRSGGQTPRVAVGPGGTVHIAEYTESGPRVQKFDPSGAFLSQISPLPPGDLGGFSVNGFAVDSTGAFYISTNDQGWGVRKYDSTGNPLATVSSNFGLFLAVDPADNLYSVQFSGLNSVNVHTVQYDSSGTLLRAIYPELPAAFLTSLAPYSSLGGDVYFASLPLGNSQLRVEYMPFPPPGPVAGPGASTAAVKVGNVKATLKSAVNPEGKATTYRFEYVDQASFEAEGFANPTETAETPVGADFKLYEVSKEVTGLEPDTVYYLRAVATNPDGTDVGPTVTFETLTPFEILATWSTDVDPTSAILHAEVNPLGIPATGYFEYVDEATFQESGFAEAVKAPDVGGGQSPLDFGDGDKALRRSATLFPLKASTKYRYRVVVENAFVAEPGSERSFTTPPPIGPPAGSCPNQAFRTGASARLPDCRAYELVSPLDKNNTDIDPRAPGINQASNTGNGMTFASWRAFADPEGAPLINPYVVFRDPTEGWRTQSIAPPRDSVSLYPNVGDSSNPFRVFSADLCSGWFQHDVDVALLPEAPTQVPNLYRRDLCGGGGYELLSTVQPPGHKYKPIESTYYPDVMGFSADNTRTVFRANAPLTPNANPTSGFYQTYVSDKGKLRLVSVLPNGTAANSEAVPGDRQFVTLTNRFDNIYRAISEDASRVFWSMSTYAEDPGLDGDQGGDPEKLYLRYNATEPQSLISGGKCTQPARACTIAISDVLGTRYESAATDGSRVIYTIKDALYEADIEEVSGQMTSVSQQIAKGTISVMGASEDAERVYFASKEVLTGVEQNSEGDSAVAGEANLYLYEKGAGFEFVAALVGWDTNAHPNGIAPLSPLARTPAQRLSRVSPDGMHAAFTSIASLTGYDNADANSGEPDAQVFHYDAASGELACVSCNPSGARPKGRQVRRPSNDTDKGDWAAALIPGWSTQFQPTRALSDDGDRLFFESFDALLPRDTNGRKDVYQWEAPGSGSCTEESSSFSDANEGCLSLISSGESPIDSTFLDASPNGSDVFFHTFSSLLPQDNGLADVYDARVEGGFPAPPSPPPACEGEACQGPVAPPNDPTPTSSTYQGSGNVNAAAKQANKAKRKQAKKKRRQAKRRAKARAKKQRDSASAKGRMGR